MVDPALVDSVLGALTSGGTTAGILFLVARSLLKGALEELRANTKAISELKASSATEADLKAATEEITEARKAIAVMTSRMETFTQQMGELRSVHQQLSTVTSDVQRHDALLAELPRLRDQQQEHALVLVRLQGTLDQLLQREKGLAVVGG